MPADMNDPKHISERGGEIYDRKYKSELEPSHSGEYFAVDVHDETGTLGKTASEALSEAKKQHPHGFFHLIRIGHRSAFEVGSAYRNVSPDRLHR